MGGRAVGDVRRLGFDYGLRRAGPGTKVLKGRLKRFRARLPRMRKLVTRATSAARVFAAGIVPSLAYEAELGPYPRDFVRHVRAKALWAHG